MNLLLEFAGTYTYLFGVILFFLVWCIVFFRHKTNRAEMLFAGVMFGAAAVITGLQYSIHDYWHPTFLFPTFPIEDFFYGFFFGGICTQIYFFFFEARRQTTKKHHFVFAVMVVFVSALSFILLTGILKLNSIIPHIVPPLFIGLYIAYKDSKDIKIQLWSGLFATVITFIIFKILIFANPNFIESVWYIDNLTGILILGIPIEEYLFAFALGFGVSHFYEFVTGRELVLKKKIT